jgi:hypothetical protein
MVRHNLDVFKGDIDFVRFLEKLLFKPALNVTNQHLPAILWSPNDVIAQVEYSLITGCPSPVIHKKGYTRDRYIT